MEVSDSRYAHISESRIFLFFFSRGGSFGSFRCRRSGLVSLMYKMQRWMAFIFTCHKVSPQIASPGTKHCHSHLRVNIFSQPLEPSVKVTTPLQQFAAYLAKQKRTLFLCIKNNYRLIIAKILRATNNFA